MPVTPALQDNALTTLATVLDELALTSDGGAVDGLLQRYINVASDFIERECGRIFYRSDAIVEDVGGRALPYTIRLARRPIIALTSIVYNGDTFDLTNVAIVDAGAGVVLRRSGWPNTAAADDGISRRTVAGSEFPDVVVTYNGGYVTPAQVDAGDFATRTLPSDLEDACVQLVTMRYRSKGVDPRVQARSFEASGLTFGSVPVPPEIAACLDHYRDIPSG